MRFLVRTLEEIFGLKSFADQSSLHVGKGDKYGVDRAVGDGFFQLSHGKRGCHFNKLSGGPSPLI